MNMDIQQTVLHCEALLTHAVGNSCYPDREGTPLVMLSREVVNTLLAAGCGNQAAVVAAALGDLPYSRTMWRDQALPAAFQTKVTFAAYFLFWFRGSALQQH
jgi:hypothetical protein